MLERILFSFVLILQAVYFVWIMIQMGIPIGHDTFQYFYLQYYFLNNAVFSHKIPLWMPFMTQGTVSSWWYGMQAALLPNALSMIAPVLKSFNFVYLFLASFWVDELLLVIGCWLWAKIFFRNIVSVFFFTLTIVGTAVWWTQPWFNFHLYYALPLMFYCCHRLISTGLLRYGIVLVSLAVLQLLGNLPYFLPMSTLIVAMYMVIYLVFNPNAVPKLTNLGWRWGYILLLALILCAIYYYVITYGTDQIVNYDPGREQDRTASISDFLQYGGGLGLAKWMEMIFGVSPNLDYTLYGGILIVPLLLSGLGFLFDKKVLPVLLLTVLIFDLSMGGIIAHAVYWVWPFMKYYRHLGLLSPVLKMLISFLAAFVLDQLLMQASAQRRRWLICSIGLSAIAVVIWDKSFFTGWCIQQMVPEQWPEAVIFKQWLMPTLGSRLVVVMVIAFLGAVMTLILALCRRPKVFNAGFIAIIILHTLDICFYKIHETLLRSISAKPYAAQLTFEPMPFHFHRQIYAKEGQRLDLIKSLPLFKGVQYWSIDSFAFIDEVGSSWRTEHWLRPLDDFMRAYWGQPIEDKSTKPRGLVYYRGLHFPLIHPAARKFSAVDMSKLQFFTDVLPVAEEKKMAQLMVNGRYLGDIPMVAAGRSTLGGENKLSVNSRLTIPYKLLNFSADELKVKLTSPRSGWLMYSDIWHPQWRASVNNCPVKLYKANLAYKIISLNQGENVVCFYFGSWQVRLCQWGLSLFSLIGIMGVFWMIGKIYENSQLL